MKERDMGKKDLEETVKVLLKEVENLKHKLSESTINIVGSDNIDIDAKRIIKSNRTHYIKLNITNNMSLRYHFTFTSKSHLEGKWILKFHKESYYQEIEDKLANIMILEHNISEYKEIVGIQNGSEFNKVILNNGNIKELTIFEE